MVLRLGPLVPIIASFCLTTAMIGCSDDSGTGGRQDAGDGAADGGNGGDDGGDPAGPVGTDDYLIEVEATGLLDYLGRFQPESDSTSDDVTTYTFEVAPDGPQCIDGTPFMTSVRDQGSDSLVIYLEGGGACWTGFSSCKRVATSGMPFMSAFDTSDATNPMRSWNHVYVSYCDGSIFVGDIQQNDGRIHHGLKNLSAGLDLARSRFPEVERVVLAGSSAGGFGTIWGAPLVRKLYPDAELFVVNDAGVGVGKPGDVEFRRFLQEDWGAEDRFPSSCAACMDSPHMTPFIGWALERDADMKVAMFSSYADAVIAGTFLQITGEAFETALLEETTPMHSEYPDRFRRFFIPGPQHTALGQWDATERDGVSLKAWLTAMLAGSPDWTDLP